MYVHHIKAENFRVFGSEAEGKSLNLKLSAGLNVLVGENDAGKSSIIDAMRFALLTTSYEYLRFNDDDFHINGVERAATLSIEVHLKGLSVSQQAAVAEWLTYTPGEDPYLVIHVKASRAQQLNGRMLRSETRYNSGLGGNGIEIGSVVRDLVRATYLKPLRDAEGELRSGRNSRLSQIMKAHKDIQKESQNDFNPITPASPPQTLVGHMARAQYEIQKSPVIGAVGQKLNSQYLANLGLVGSHLSGQIKVASELSLAKVLEQLELSLVSPEGVSPELDCGRGLGFNNVLFMATELLLLERQDELSLLLIEEPEAHLHPQLQARVLELLESRSDSKTNPVQTVVSTHSPNLAASAPVESLILVSRGKTFRLAKGETKLEVGDYSFLRRFLDVTKANLFFARAVALVEGPAEMLLLPAIADACNRSFREAGVSMVDVGGIGLFRYARILQRNDEEVVPIPVACLTDRDVVPDHIAYVEDKKDKDGKIIPRKYSQYGSNVVDDLVAKKVARAEGGCVKVFVSDNWTFEYDLASTSLRRLMAEAVALARKSTAKDGVLTKDEHKEVMDKVASVFQENSAKTAEFFASNIYKPLYSKQVSKTLAAQFAAELLGTGRYGTGDALLCELPKYLRDALVYLVPNEINKSKSV